MPRELIIAAGSGEWRAALIEDGVAVELRVERGDGNEAGSIHLGRVRRLLPALGAALVDIGGDRPAFLPQSEILPRGRRLDEGERVLVQIRREAQGGKAARLTTAIALRGRLIELVAGRSGLSGIEKLSSETCERLKELIETLTHSAPSHSLPRERGRVRVGAGSPPSRIAGAGAERSKAGEGTAAARSLQPTPIGLRLLEPGPSGAVVHEAEGLVRRWREVGERARGLNPPARLDPPATLAAALAGALPTADRVLVDEPAAIPEIRAAFPDAAVAHEPETEWPIGLDALFEEALSPTIALAGGGSLHIEMAQAAVLIDVDSGTPETESPGHTALAVDLAAAEAVARQIRLRNLGGGIVVDFVGLDDRGSRERVRAALAGALAADPARPQILGWTRLGHLELVRPRRGRPLFEALLEPAAGGALVKTPDTVAHGAPCAPCAARPGCNPAPLAVDRRPRNCRRAGRQCRECPARGRAAARGARSRLRPIRASSARVFKSPRCDYIGDAMTPDSPIPTLRRCPICGKAATLQHRPFCSARCAQIDLGRWLKGNYRIPSDEPPDESDEEDRPADE